MTRHTVQVDTDELARLRRIVRDVEQAAAAPMPASGSGAAVAAAAAVCTFARSILDTAREESRQMQPGTSGTPDGPAA